MNRWGFPYSGNDLRRIGLVASAAGAACCEVVGALPQLGVRSVLTLLGVGVLVCCLCAGVLACWCAGVLVFCLSMASFG